MKILVVGKNNLMLWPQKVNQALRQNGHQTELFLFNKQTPMYCLLRLLGKKRRLKFLASYLRDRILKTKPDLILFISFSFIPDAFYQLLTEFPRIQTAGWSGDKFGTDSASKANFLDVLFCSDTGYLNATKDFKCRSLYLPLCVDEMIYKNEHLPKIFSPFFAGVANPLRTKYLAACERKCILYGKGWDKKKMPQHEIHNHKIPHEKVQKLIGQSIAPINICFSPNIVNGLNFRVFEVGACGGLIMINESKDLALCYEPGVEAVTYTTPDDFNHLIYDIEQHPEKYEKIAKAGYERTLREHTYRKRMEQMLKMLKT